MTYTNDIQIIDRVITGSSPASRYAQYHAHDSSQVQWSLANTFP